MLSKIFFVLATLYCCECVFLYSSFWAPLFNPRILNYRVDVQFDPDAGKNARDEYTIKYGVRGKQLIEDFGNGKMPKTMHSEDKALHPVKFYYTYNGADKNKDTYSP